MPITHFAASGQNIYVMFDDASDTAVDFTEGSSNKVGRYQILDSAIASAGLSAGSYAFRILLGTAATKSPTNTLDGVGELMWDGSNERDKLDEVLADLSTLLGGIVAPAVIQHSVSADFTLVSNDRRVDKTPTIYINGITERVRIAWNVVTITDAVPVSVTSVEVFDDQGAATGNLTLSQPADTSNCGVRNYLVLTKITGCSAAGTYTARVTFINSSGDTIVEEGLIVVS